MKKIITILLVCILACSAFGLGTAAENTGVTVTLDNNIIEFPDAQPYITQNRTLVPIRFVSEAMGADVIWDEAEQKVTIVKGKDTIITHILSAKATLNGVIYTFDASTRLKNDRTFVPLRFIAELLNCDVQWIEETSTVVITSPPAPVAFPEPKITVHYPDNEWTGKLLWITLDNLRDYSDCDNYEFKIDFTTPAEFNVFEQDEGAINGWMEHSLNQWRKILRADSPIVEISQKYYTTRANKETLKLYEGMPLEFTLSVKRKCSGEIKEYSFTDTFQYPYSAKD